MLGKVLVEGEGGEGVEFEDPNLRNLVAEVSCKVRMCVIVNFWILTCILLWMFISSSTSPVPSCLQSLGLSPHCCRGLWNEEQSDSLFGNEGSSHKGGSLGLQLQPGGR